MRAIISGSCGLVGSSAVSRLLDNGWQVVGIDNNSREEFFGAEGSTKPILTQFIGHPHYVHHSIDVTHQGLIEDLFRSVVGADLVIHCAAQPSHDWSTMHIRRDFEINAIGTLNMLQAWHKFCSNSPFIHLSTSKVYGDNPNRLKLLEYPTRYDLRPGHDMWHGIPESFPLDQCIHSFFGVSKLSGDLLAQEYGRRFRLPVSILRPGCVTGGNHKGVELHGFLNYLVKCVAAGKEYKIIGYKGKQVRCNIHADDLVDAALKLASHTSTSANSEDCGAVYNIGGRGLDCSILEAIEICEEICGRKAITTQVESPRVGDHQWWVSDSRKLRRRLDWSPRMDLQSTIRDIYEGIAYMRV